MGLFYAHGENYHAGANERSIMPPAQSVNGNIILQSLVVAGVLALAGAVWNLSVQVNTMAYKVDTALGERYTEKEATKDWEVQKGANSLIQQRLDAHSGILSRQQSIIDHHESMLRDEIALKR